jgi:3-hydroxy-9,10-secoandrosta-1,3,5(10)-triene-9,17-dione monooxygenase
MGNAMDGQAGTIPTAAELVARARAMIPTLAERASRQQEHRRILPETMAELKSAGFFRILQPKRWGGYEMEPGAFFDVQMALSEGDVSVGWVHGILGVHSFHLALFDDRAAEDVWGQDSSRLVASPYSPGRAVPVEGGYKLTGRWRFSSGTEHCDWIFLGGVIDRGGDGQGSFLDADFRTFLLPRADYQIIDTWKVVGLKGTGSQDVVVDGSFVPEHRTHRMRDATGGTNPGSAPSSSALYRYPYWQVFLRAVSTAAIGGLQGMVDAFAVYGARRVSVTGAKTILDPDATLALAEAQAGIDEMKATLHRNFHRMAPYAEKGEMPPLKDRLLFKYQCVSVAKRSADLALPMFRLSGGSGVFESQPFGRFYTDIVAMGNHAANNYPSAGRNWGSVMMGLESTDTLL